MKQSALEAHFLQWVLEQRDIPPPRAEHQFAYPRRWRFDFAWIQHRVAVEIDGGLFVAGRHGRGAGIIQDAEKMLEAAARGWRVIRVPSVWIVDSRGKPTRNERVMEVLRGMLNDNA